MSAYNFAIKLEFNVNGVFNTKKQTTLGAVMDAFEGENMQAQYCILSYRIDLYFHDYRLAIVANEFNHSDTNINNEIRRQNVKRFKRTSTVRIVE